MVSVILSSSSANSLQISPPTFPLTINRPAQSFVSSPPIPLSPSMISEVTYEEEAVVILCLGYVLELDVANALLTVVVFGLAILLPTLNSLVEVAENLILVCIKSAMLHDEGAVEMWDLENSFTFFGNDSANEKAPVSCFDNGRFEYQEVLVVFFKLHGMAQLNDGKPIKIKHTRPCSFTLEEDITRFDNYKKGVIVSPVKLAKILNFKLLGEAIKHLEDNTQRLIFLAVSVNESLGDMKLEDINSKRLRQLAFGLRLLNSHHDAQIFAFDFKLPKILEDVAMLIVNIGALGYDFLRNLALMGVLFGE
ncbi:hypothetical protein Tsubulata_018708 [Turnera subulata]|uniref:Ubiquitin-activating enzyme E1 FCCH domain-containing protein n=1 Tax=Turnera subulata TaxID=218843 RepID=A0A9Q0FZX5_9ROSI|nr:hypothetical protein Tsubulata_018708 [Turnera subulata]